MPTLIESIMSSKVVTVDPDTAISDVISQLYAYRVSCVVVCEEDLPLGIVTERDAVGVALSLAAGLSDRETRARDIMSAPLATLTTSDPLKAALDRVLEGGISHIPVLDGNGRLAGLVTERDLLRAFGGR